MKTAAEVIQSVQRWADEYAASTPGFVGAYLFGGITELPGDAPFPPHRDVDLVIVTDDVEQAASENLELDWHDLMLEIGYLSMQEHDSPETVLGDPKIAPNLVTSPIVADPFGVLRPLQEAVRQKYAQEQWVIARCDAEKKAIQEWNDAIGASPSSEERLGSVWYCLNFCAGLLAVASLRKPTHRRTLTLLKEIVTRNAGQNFRKTHSLFLALRR
ncbi:MAG: hypothetical protein HC802_22955 [Caldilineaceae bacterium]|nr:hypothetical protein [Caldilineaceae bacterium]